ncbi:tryptophan halogenase family protein [Pseudoalteromonas sp. PS5]|uniref:tryptophan halogenase family protein n=1 Tax=Pseudoalteromonas sp. PS5 TaxID=1437473 RepID=UPI000FFF1DA1|nr:tryptophan halogenase family protein [Pseudoalteromonas sp. PS5]RXF06097.1 tryptophan 7-halogenase [Pseudoalteromonas sp. PS5]
MKLQKVIILGGGTAGWLAANHLAKRLNAELSLDIHIELIESESIPAVGVGEGTVPFMKETLKHFGIDEELIFKNAEGSFKHGIKFSDWLYNPESNNGHYYYHPFQPYPSGHEQLIRAWLSNPNRCKFEHFMSTQATVAELGLSPKAITQREYDGVFDYAYHFDAALFTKLLKDNAVNELGVHVSYKTIDDVEISQDGSIKGLIANGERFDADFFVDCSGFESLLLGRAMNVGFKSLSNTLLADTALAIQSPYQDNSTSINPYTTATAKEHGWIWDIQLQSRKGVGYVYSSNHTSDDDAQRCLALYLDVEPQELNVRKIDMRCGYREQFWVKNVVALGLAQGFVEPLEATGLLVFDLTASMLAHALSSGELSFALESQKFNRDVERMWLNISDFIKLHYCLSKRTDSSFWLDNCSTDTIPDSLQQKLEMWKVRAPHKFDFTDKLGVFDISNYLYVLYGMEFLPTQVVTSEASMQIYKGYQEYQASVLKEVNSNLRPHRELLEKLKLYGIQRN